ncbi:FKBP-type peptidyl-prolyl cis-trans isomerase [Bernardetia litoralis DSM 6794]|uniref:Peptidyl-prolyl cis-trans isomerase n=1 Tax=Bernardetia litoralis (strain ATCC 23117 / DSM 6794 / NBRC 15988 / NCIMB 1366 / Fx l1 / Sio-4) TaxID=880071 RepID=I4AGX1_BERLS|nr:FKBP-type peptidyl-prolyl cis-trans isomerase [Bernardetia litoralis]AFM03206.1 FKBP-type peptidyl-prolyl cis-trans isomerase [Bernardetia litoralis DSM 6794]
MKLSKYIFLLFPLFSLLSSCNNDEIEPLIDSTLQAEREDQIIQQYLAENNLTAQQTDLGIYYIVLEEGEGSQNPTTTDSVTVNYVGTVLYGRQFDSSYETATPLGFVIGEGTVVTGFEEAVKQMKIGENTRFFIPSRYAYGESGITSGDREIIPTLATLIFEIKLEEINE